MIIKGDITLVVWEHPTFVNLLPNLMRLQWFQTLEITNLQKWDAPSCILGNISVPEGIWVDYPKSSSTTEKRVLQPNMLSRELLHIQERLLDAKTLSD